MRLGENKHLINSDNLRRKSDGHHLLRYSGYYSKGYKPTLITKDCCKTSTPWLSMMILLFDQEEKRTLRWH